MMTQNFDFSLEQWHFIESIRETRGIPGVAAASCEGRRDCGGSWLRLSKP